MDLVLVVKWILGKVETVQIQGLQSPENRAEKTN
jgi:hypothetical protein